MKPMTRRSLIKAAAALPAVGALFDPGEADAGSENPKPRDFSDAGWSFEASPILLGDHLCLLDNSGVVLIVPADREAAKPRKAELGELCLGATPAFAAGRLYVRGWKNLYCIARANSE